MTKPRTPTIEELQRGMRRFRNGDRPWQFRSSDWHIATEDGTLYPLKYTFGLALDEQPSKYTTNEVKAALEPLAVPLVNIAAEKEALRNFEKKVASSLCDPKGRKARLKKTPKTPKKSFVARNEFVRNPDVVAEVLENAKGICGNCQKPAPFSRAKDGAPYLEVHHKITLANGGPDTVENAIALCPNCHRRAHYG